MSEAVPNFEEQLLRDKDVATIYGINRATAWTWAKAGRIPKPLAGVSRWRKSEIYEHIRGMKHAELREKTS